MSSHNLTDEKVGKILAAAPEPFGTILALTSVLGLRIGEVLAPVVNNLYLPDYLTPRLSVH